MANLDAALERIRSTAPSTTVQGRRFERLFRAALLNHPGEFRDKFAQVWLWKDWPRRDGPDAGIDLVAEDHDGNEWAIQCKDYASAAVTTAEVNKFLGAAGGFHGRLFVSTSKKPIPKVAWANLNKAPNCRVLTLGDLDGWPVDWAQFVDIPESLAFDHVPYEPRPYQTEAVEAIDSGFASHARGKLILPCGTGKSVVALWAAEDMFGENGRVLYVVPSISLMGQTMREWATHRSTAQRYIGVCSDSSAGRRGSEDANLTELSIPVTTNPEAIHQALMADTPGEMTVVFSTYQSLQVIADAQANGAAPFDLMVCDEAHRTTGVHKQGKTTVSSWLLPHDQTMLQADRRLYMTATPRLYSANVKEKAKDRQVAVYSMDDGETYGPEFYKMSFKKAVDDGYLSDYEVAIVAVSDGIYANLAGDFVAEHKETGVNVKDVVKLLGCWDALADPTTRGTNGRVTGQINTHHVARRAIAFSNTIKSSTNLEKWWPDIITRLAADIDKQDSIGEALLDLQVKHIDGKTRASLRAQALNDLDGDIPDGECHLITNAKCLTEGVDVPALDAVLFMEPRRSKIEIVQAVGRVMRRAEGKKRGYIVLPVIVPEGKRITDSAFLRSSTFQPVWDVISALRAHDERMDVWVNTADIGGKPPVKVIETTGGSGENGDKPRDDPTDPIQEFAQMSLPLNEEIASALVERCGDKRYWTTWGRDVAEVANRIRNRIETLITRPDQPQARQAFDRFLGEMRQTINEHLQPDQLIRMLASHLVTLPVFEALFGNTDFAHRNPVVKALTNMTNALDDQGLLNEAKELDHFYQSVKVRVQEVTDPDGRLQILLDLYESFFKEADPKEASRSGIVYTPIEIVDFILRSADHVARQEFGKGLTDENVHILDPFTGTGTFINRLLTLPDLIADEDLPRKYASELHANEWLLLPYYIAAVKIEQGYMARRPDDDYQPFEGIVLTDTFELNSDQPTMPTMSGNSERAQRQADLPIQVIVGNPPWKAGQKSASDDNPNVPHPGIERRIRETYAAHGIATLKNSLRDLYKLSIRWATDRLGERGIIAFVTPNGYIDGTAEDGMRACLADEFTCIYVFNLRGRVRISGEASRREGGKIFGNSTPVGVAIVVMIRNPENQHEDCRISYRDIGDYLNLQEKRQVLVDAGSIDGIEGWQTITPDQHNDWINQRDATWETLLRLGHKDAKANRPGGPDTAMRLYSGGVKTNRDPYLYSHDDLALATHAEQMVRFYEKRREDVKGGAVALEEAVTKDSLHIIKWTGDMEDRLKRNAVILFSDHNLRIAHHRPFVKQWLYFDPQCINRVYRIPAMFPTGTTANQAIAVSGKGSTKDFSVLITSITPDLELVSKSQVFPRYVYPGKPHRATRGLSGTSSLISASDATGENSRVDNITDSCLTLFQVHYKRPNITKDDIWAYLYGVLHAPDWRNKYASELRKDLPRFPLATDFRTFQQAGQRLIDLHLGYETCKPWPLEVITPENSDDPDLYRIDDRMRWNKVRNADGKLELDRSVLHINARCRVEGIPDEAHHYEVNGKTPLDWAIDRLKISTDRESGITNDANQWHAWAEDPYQLVLHLQRLVRVSVETARIVKGLPSALSPDPVQQNEIPA